MKLAFEGREALKSARNAGFEVVFNGFEAVFGVDSMEGHSAISYLLAWKRELQDKAEWSENLAYLDKAWRPFEMLFTWRSQLFWRSSRRFFIIFSIVFQHFPHVFRRFSTSMSLRQALARITLATSPKTLRPKVAVDQGVVELWERVLDATEAHNLTFEASDGLVTGHAHVLKEASPVLKAMLDAGQRTSSEGERD